MPQCLLGGGAETNSQATGGFCARIRHRVGSVGALVIRCWLGHPWGAPPPPPLSATMRLGATPEVCDDDGDAVVIPFSSKWAQPAPISGAPARRLSTPMRPLYGATAVVPGRHAADRPAHSHQLMVRPPTRTRAFSFSRSSSHLASATAHGRGRSRRSPPHQPPAPSRTPRTGGPQPLVWNI